MRTRMGKSVVFTAPGLPLSLVTRDVPDPAPGEALVRVTHAGICGTDVHRLAGDVGAPPEPVCFGHECVGIIDSLGEGLTTDRRGTPITVGDRVCWFPMAPGAPCMTCLPCISGMGSSFCQSAQWPIPVSIARNAAGFQEYALVGPRAPLYRVPDATASESVIAFGCAMHTAYSAFLRLGDVPKTVVIQGCGPVGLACTAMASCGGAEQVIVIGDSVAGRLSAATRLGATSTIALDSTSAEERHELVLSATGGIGAEAVIEAAGHISAFPEGLHLVAGGGRYVILGIFSGSATTPFNPAFVNNRNISIIGCLSDPAKTLAPALDFATEHGQRLGFAEIISHRYPLDRTEDAIRAAGDGTARKAVVLPDH